MINPMDGFNQGLMTGRRVGAEARQNRDNRQIGGLMASGDYAGAASAAYGAGDLGAGHAIQRHDQDQQARGRGQQITGALRTGSYDEAMSFASTPEELAQITQFRDSATEAQRTQAAEAAGNFAVVAQGLRALPVEQRVQRAQQLAPQFGLDPSEMTLEALTDEAIDIQIMKAMGLKDFLTMQGQQSDREQRGRLTEAQITATEALTGQRQAQAAKASRPPAPRARSGQAATNATAAPRPVAGLPANFTVRGG